MKAVGDKVIVRIQEADASIGSIIIPATAQGAPTRGSVVSVGDDVSASFKLREGCIILFPGYAGVNIEIDGVKHKVLKQDDILATL